ncbi:MAG: hypothetical protein E6K29_17985 [Gammaproteobacteria bacterium]|nr:MAG: hypothetical protein E6K29_17985 [Gammaproteobacteria bacterium]
MKNLWIAMMAFGLALGNASAQAQETKDSEETEAAEAAKNAPALAAALKDATVSLEAGLQASEAEGKPKDGKLQLSVYTAKGGQFFEVIVDHKTGKITKAEPITEANDLKDAKKQSNAMAKAKSTLADAVAKAVKANSGYRAVSAAAEIEGGAANADVGLVKGSSSKNVDEKL